jgi:cell division protein FtsB
MLNAECAGSFQPPCFRDKAGHLWFATVGGIVVVDPAHLSLPPKPPPVRIEYLHAEGPSGLLSYEGQHGVEEFVVPPGRNRLELGYAALSLTAGAHAQFRFRLDGLDQKWVPAGTRRVAYYSKVPPGEYFFRVSACNSDGEWNPQEAIATVNVQAFWWETRTFQLALCIVVGAVGLGIARSIHKRGLAKDIEKAQRQSEQRHAVALGAANARLEARTTELERALANVKVLRGLIPICAGCKKVRDDQGYWSQVEKYVGEHSEATFSHGLCPDCAERYFPLHDSDPGLPGGVAGI